MEKQLIVSENFDFKPSSRKYLDNGFLRVSGRAARTGVYEYLASELGIDDRPQNDIIRVYRPESEVFDNNSIESYSNVDVTNDHPSEFVDSRTFREKSVGHVISASRDGDFVNVDMIIKDESAIRSIEAGKTQLSPGYSAVYVKEDGVAPCGTNYHYKQTSIDVNHVAIVSRGRGGSQVRLNDKKPTQPEKVMTKIVLDSGRSLDLDDGAKATLIQDSFERLVKRAEDAESKASELEKIQATCDAQKEKIESLESELKKATDSEVIKEKIAELSKVKDSAALVAGKEFTCDSTNVMDIKRLALAQVRDSIDWAEKSDEYVNAAFDFATADAEAKKEEKSESMDEDEDEDDKETNDAQIAKLSKDAGIDPVKTIDHDGARKFMSANNWKITTGMVTMAELKQQSKDIYGV